MKFGNVVVGQIKAPKNGIFNGRSIPKTQIDNVNWLKVLELPVPPEDGLYIRRSAVSEVQNKLDKKTKKKGFLYKIAKAMVDYERNYDKKQNAKSDSGAKPSANTTSRPGPEPSLASTLAQSQTPTVKPVESPTSWLSLSPDIESELLGLEQLGPNEHLAIIGTGITGLTLAYMLSKSRPDINITLIDNRRDVGGWMQSKTVEVPGGETLFESGPRTLLPSHPGSEIVARILHEIGEREKLMGGVSRKASVNAKALVLDGKINYLPRNWRETIAFLGWGPLLKGGRLSAISDLWTSTRNTKVHDESVNSFVKRRLGSTIADRMISAIMRGIYGADSKLLSARSVARFNRLYYLERTEQMSALGAMLTGGMSYLEAYNRSAIPLAFDSLTLPDPPSKDATKEGTKANKTQAKKDEAAEVRALTSRARNFSLYGFPEGIQSVPQAIAKYLSKNPKIQFVMDTNVSLITKNGSKQVRLSTSNPDMRTLDANVVVSTVAKPEMFELAAPEVAKDLKNTKYSSLAVVNVWVPDETTAKDAFGVLVPKSEDKWNKDKVLGVIFDSSVRKNIHPVDEGAVSSSSDVTESSNPDEKGSSLTVMLGGDLWDNVSDEEWRERALNALSKLDILDEKYLQPNSGVVTQVVQQRNAIPLYEVGHSIKQQRVHQKLSSHFNNRVALVGMAYGRGCGVSDCVVDSLMLALRFSEQRKLLYPQFFFEHWWRTTRPEYYA